MKIVTTLLYLILSVGAGCQLIDRSPLAAPPARNAGREVQVPRLTENEEQSFNSLVTSQIRWFFNWRYTELSCHYSETIDIATNYQQLVDQQIDMKLVITRKCVFAYFAPLH